MHQQFIAQIHLQNCQSGKNGQFLIFEEMEILYIYNSIFLDHSSDF